MNEKAAFLIKPVQEYTTAELKLLLIASLGHSDHIKIQKALASRQDLELDMLLRFAESENKQVSIVATIAFQERIVFSPKEALEIEVVMLLKFAKSSNQRIKSAAITLIYLKIKYLKLRREDCIHIFESLQDDLQLMQALFINKTCPKSICRKIYEKYEVNFIEYVIKDDGSGEHYSDYHYILLTALQLGLSNIPEYLAIILLNRITPYEEYKHNCKINGILVPAFYTTPFIALTSFSYGKRGFEILFNMIIENSNILRVDPRIVLLLVEGLLPKTLILNTSYIYNPVKLH